MAAGLLENAVGANDRVNQANSLLFATIFQAYLECSEAIQQGIREMVAIINDPAADEDEKAMAIHTLAEALFPKPHGGSLGLDLHEAEEMDTQDSSETAAVLKRMDTEEATFAERLRRIMEETGLTQEQLANAVGVGQSAIAMMLTRNCRPQRRTVAKLAAALGVVPGALWPESDAQ